MEKEYLLLEKLKLAHELHKHEDNLVWERFHHFMVLTSILIPGFGLQQSNILDPSNQTVKLIIGITISSFGIISSIIFSLIFKNSEAWQRLRNEQAREAETQLIIHGKQVIDIYKHDIYGKKFQKLSFAGKFDPYYLIYLLGIFITFIWIILLLLILAV